MPLKLTLGHPKRYVEQHACIVRFPDGVERAIQRRNKKGKLVVSATNLQLLEFIAFHEGSMFDDEGKKLFTVETRSTGRGELAIRHHFGYPLESPGATGMVDIPELGLEVKAGNGIDLKIKPGVTEQDVWLRCWRQLLYDDAHGRVVPGYPDFLLSNLHPNLTYVEAMANGRELSRELQRQLPAYVSDYIQESMRPERALHYPNLSYAWPNGFIIIPKEDYQQAWTFTVVSQTMPKFVLQRCYLEQRALNIVARTLKERPMKKIGIVAGSFKPFHRGHRALIELASQENDQVRLYVSLDDRSIPGQVPIKGETMARLWNEDFAPILPKNVSVEYTRSQPSPVRKVYDLLGTENEAGSDDRYTIYGDGDDLDRNYPTRSLEKYADRLFAQRQIVLEPVSRLETVPVSGTEMRGWLHAGDEQAFINNLPEGVDGKKVWEAFKADGTDVVPLPEKKKRSRKK